MRATKMIHSCKNLPYIERLKVLNLPTLKLRRLRGDMIEVYKILHGFYDGKVTPNLIRNKDSRTRGNSFKLSYVRSKYDLRKYSFSVRVTGVWNSLPEYVVISDSLNSFKNNLDKLWVKENVYYDWEADLTLSY